MATNDSAYLSYRHAIGSIESSNNYSSIGPATRNGDRAYGRYQVMGNNIPEWSEKYYGQRLTPQEFLQNQEAQDKVFDAKFGGDVAKYGNPQDAASVWFSGRPLAQAGNANDLYISTPEYVNRFTKALQGAPTGDGAPTQTASAATPSPANATPASAPQSGGMLASISNLFSGNSQAPQQAGQGTPLLSSLGSGLNQQAMQQAMQVPQGAPIYYAPRRAPNLAPLQAALQGGFYFPQKQV